MDVTKIDDITNCIVDIEKRYGNLDVLISNAGVSLRGTIADTSIDVHRKMMEVNYFGVVNLVKGVNYEIDCYIVYEANFIGVITPKAKNHYCISFVL